MLAFGRELRCLPQQSCRRNFLKLVASKPEELFDIGGSQLSKS